MVIACGRKRDSGILSARRLCDQRTSLQSPDSGMFEGFRESLAHLMDRRTTPEARRSGLVAMRQTLVQARMGLDDLRAGISATRQRLEAEQRELETVRRRKGLAAGIDDQETVRIASEYETRHDERAEVLRQKLAAQEAELHLVEREVAAMTADLKRANAGMAPEGGDRASIDAAARRDVDEMLGARDDVASEIDALGRANARNARSADAERQLAELKRRMGK